MNRRHIAHWVLVAYLGIYITAIALALAATHNLGSAAMHTGLLTVGGLTLRSILPNYPNRSL